MPSDKAVPSSGALNGVSCFGTARNCRASGRYYSTTGAVFLNEGWSQWDAKWYAQKSAVGVGLKAISCSAGDSCVSLGYHYNPLPMPHSAVWNGTTWTAKNVPLPASASAGDGTGVSCVGYLVHRGG
jgi:hypothetical protein